MGFFNLFKNNEKIVNNKRNEYKPVGKKAIPSWIHKKFNKILRENNPWDIENKNFYFKGKKYKYIIHYDFESRIQGIYTNKLKYYKRKRGKIKK